METGPWIWLVAGSATAAVILRPFRLPEAIWAASGVLILLVFHLLPFAQAMAGVRRGTSVYLFLAGMMLMAELARRERVFDWLAAMAARRAAGSGPRLFLLIYAVGTLVTVFLSNDATAVVLTPAVFAVTRAVGASPLPYLYICAFIANAASFVLPVSNPANLVVFGTSMPPLSRWFALFALPSLVAIVATYALLRWRLRADIAPRIHSDISPSPLSRSGRLAVAGLVGAAVILTACAWNAIDLGMPTLMIALLTLLLVWFRRGQSPLSVVKAVSWSVIPLVAALFVFVQALEYSGAIGPLSDALTRVTTRWPQASGLMVGGALSLVSNLANNLPVGLLAGSVLQSATPAPAISAAALIGVALGPNLSVTGSLATILWLNALRREGLHVGVGQFFKLGLLVMPPTLLFALFVLHGIA